MSNLLKIDLIQKKIGKIKAKYHQFCFFDSPGQFIKHNSKLTSVITQLLLLTNHKYFSRFSSSFTVVTLFHSINEISLVNNY